MKLCAARLFLGLIGIALTGCAAASPSAETTKAAFDQGLAAYDAGDYAGAFRQWNAIRNDDLAALRNVAVMLRTGKGTEKDPAEAQRLMTIAAEAGLSSSAFNLGEMLLDGEAGPPDVAAGILWLKRAAWAGQPLAALRLGIIYRDGKLVPADPKLARGYLQRAATAGNEQAKAALDGLAPP